MFGVPVGAGGLSRVRFSRTAEALALPRAPLFGFDGPGAAAAGPGHARAAASGVGCLPDAADAAPTRRGTNSAAGFRASVRRRRIERRRAAAAFGDGADDALAAAADAAARARHGARREGGARGVHGRGADDAARRAADGAAGRGRGPLRERVTVPLILLNHT